jgi:hypothetical protein
VNGKRGLLQAKGYFYITKFDIVDANMAVCQWVVTQRLAGCEAATVKSGEVQFFLFSESCGQNPLGSEAGQTG